MSRSYDPYDRSVFGGLGRAIDGNHFAAMREYYTRGKRAEPLPPVHVGEITVVKKEPIALPAAPKMLAITEKATC